MNEIIKFLLARDKFMPEMGLRQPRFAYRAYRPFTKNKEKYNYLKKQDIHDILSKTN